MQLNIKGISAELNNTIYNLLRWDENQQSKDPQISKDGMEAEKKLQELGLIDENSQFIPPNQFNPLHKHNEELNIAAQWLYDNI